jgi:hypothetical protein
MHGLTMYITLPVRNFYSRNENNTYFSPPWMTWYSLPILCLSVCGLWTQYILWRLGTLNEFLLSIFCWNFNFVLVMNNKYPYSESNNRKMETGSDVYTSAFALIKLHLTKIATTRRVSKAVPSHLLYWAHVVIIINKASLSSLPLLSSFLPRTQRPK